MWRQTSHNTQHDPPHTHGTCVKAEKGQAWLLQCRQAGRSRGSERPSCLFGGAISVSLGHTWGLQMLRRCAQPVGGDNQRSQEGRDTHLGCPDLPSVSEGNRAPHTQLQQEHLHSWIRLRDPPAGQRHFPRYPNPASPPSSPWCSHGGCQDLSIVSYPMHHVSTFSLI